MKLLRIRHPTKQTPLPCILDSDSYVRDLSSLLEDISASEITEKSTLLKKIDITQLPLMGTLEECKLLPCVPLPRQFIAIAFNSKEHAKQMGISCGNEPIFFIKTVSTICGANDPLIYPKIAQKVDWEAELGVIIGKKGKYIPIDSALDYVLGYCCANDVSDRHWQFEHTGTQYVKGKSFETFSPLGPFLVTKEEIPDPNHLNVKLQVNGNIRQKFSTSDYQFNVEEIINFLSQFFPLEPGDVISMGSGPGSAKMWNNEYLKIGDILEFEIEHLGKQIRKVIKED